MTGVKVVVKIGLLVVVVITTGLLVVTVVTTIGFLVVARRFLFRFLAADGRRLIDFCSLPPFSCDFCRLALLRLFFLLFFVFLPCFRFVPFLPFCLFFTFCWFPLLATTLFWPFFPSPKREDNRFTSGYRCKNCSIVKVLPLTSFDPCS